MDLAKSDSSLVGSIPIKKEWNDVLIIIINLKTCKLTW